MQDIWESSSGPFLLIWLFLTTIALATTLERSRYGKYIPGPILILVIPGTLSNIGVIPSDAPIYSAISNFAVPVGIVLLLLRADVMEILRSTGKMLPLFIAAGIGALLSLLVLVRFFPFEDGARLGATMSALYIGSVINVVATAQALELDGTALAAILAANSLVASFYLAAVLVLMRSKLVGKLMGAAPGSSISMFDIKVRPQVEETNERPRPPIGVLNAIIFAVGLSIVVEIVAERSGLGNFSIMLTTALAVLVPNLAPKIRTFMDGDKEMGMIIMYMFIATVASQIQLYELGVTGLLVVLFMAATLSINLLFLLAIGRLFKADPHIIFLASLAGIGGPTISAAVAGMQKREDLVTPGILCALFGVITSTFVAVVAYQLFAAIH